MKTTKLRRIGTSTGVILPKEVLDEMNVAAGDEITLVRTERGIELIPYDPEFEEMMEVYRQGAKKYRNALRELAK
ncbi:MAG: AbrB/MazE/SpoVT family DNA-binding domain-containing protein [Gemmatimonadota bacterium]|jgi:putative addiction module antidote|nr:AbrB/MazE/SpoVT family DNA-binding domain-containing protein [Gemmatimonadota bacterium]